MKKEDILENCWQYYDTSSGFFTITRNVFIDMRTCGSFDSIPPAGLTDWLAGCSLVYLFIYLSIYLLTRPQLSIFRKDECLAGVRHIYPPKLWHCLFNYLPALFSLHLTISKDEYLTLCFSVYLSPLRAS